MGYAVGLRDEDFRRDCPFLFKTGTAQTHDDEAVTLVICRGPFFGKEPVMAITWDLNIISILLEKNRKGVNVRTSHNLEVRLPSN